MNGNVKISKDDKIRLLKYKKHLRDLLVKRKATAKRKKILVQKGSGFLPIILSAVLSLLQ